MIRQSIIVLLLVLSLTPALHSSDTSAKNRNQTISVDVNVVLVNAAVSDSIGRMVTGLRQESFRIWEDKVEQKVEYFSSEDSPMSIGLIFDATGSMADRISSARDAAASFLRASNRQDEYFLVTFSQRATLDEPFTTDISRLQSHMLFTPAKGLTPLFDALYLGLQTIRNATNRRRALLLITDGEDNHSRYSSQDIKQFIKEEDVQIFVIGIVDPGGQLDQGQSGRSIIDDLARIGGGEAYFPESTDQLEDICNKIALELRNQYVLGYHPTNTAKDGKWRKIRLKINPPKGLRDLSVHGKSGYYAESTDIKP